MLGAILTQFKGVKSDGMGFDQLGCDNSSIF